MKNKVKLIYAAFQEFPNVCVYVLLFFKIIFQKSNVKLNKRFNEFAIDILGNGPSGITTYLDFKKVENELMCVNYFALTENFFLFKPSLYVLLDPVFFTDINNKKNLKLTSTINRITWDMNLFIPSKYIKIYRKVITNDHVKLKAIRINYLPGNNLFVYFLYKKNLAVPKFQNVIISCIYISLNYNVSQINLHGVESSEFTGFKVNEKNEVLLTTNHFYGHNVYNISKQGRVKPKEFWKFLMNYVYMFKGYSEVSNYAEFLETKVINHTVDSFIDSFEKIN